MAGNSTGEETMATKAVSGRSAVAGASPLWKQMPPRMRVLYVTTQQRTGGWLAEAFAADSACAGRAGRGGGHGCRRGPPA